MLKGKKTIYIVMMEIIVAFIYTFCAYSSPLYIFSGSPFFYSVAKAMCHGSILYRDILEQKGLLTYVFYMPAYLISNMNYVGVWLMELLLVLINTFLVYKIAKKWGLSEIDSLAATVIFSALVYTHMAGYLVEFDVLPCFLFSVYLLVKQKEAMKARDVFLNGLMAGIILWSKFSLLGFYFAYAAILCFRWLFQKKVWKAIQCGLQFLAGMALVSIPCLLYFGINGALPEMFQYYFVNNISGYGYSDMSTIKNIVINYLIDVPAWEMQWSPVLFIALVISVIGILTMKMDAWKKVLLIVSGATHYIAVFFHGAMFDYYLFGFAAYAIFETIFIIKAGNALLNIISRSIKVHDIAAGVVTAAAVLTAVFALLPGKISAINNYQPPHIHLWAVYENRGGVQPH